MQIYNDANCIRVPHVHCETARFMAYGDNDFDGLTQNDVKEMMESGQLLIVSQDQFALILQKMDIWSSWDKAPNGRAEPTTMGENAGPVKTKGKVARTTTATRI